MREIVRNTLGKPLLALSLGLNLAFVTVWLVQILFVPGGTGGLSGFGNDVAVPTALHREIGVTEEQWQQIEPLLKEFREKAATQHRQISGLRDQLMDLLAAPEPDEAAIRTKQEEILSGQRLMQNLVIDHLLEERKLLSPAQAKKFIELLCEQCRHNGDMPSVNNHSRLLLGE